MPDQATTSVPLDDFCKTYNVPMVKILGHVGDGKSDWGEPLCPRIHSIGAEGCICKGEVEAAKEPVKSDAGTATKAAPPADAQAKPPAAPPAAL